MTDEVEVPHINIMFCTPGHAMIADYVKSLLATAAELNNRGITWGFANGSSSHVADAREVTLSGASANYIDENRPFNGQITYDKLMWIDSDIAWNPSDVIKLYESDKDIITGGYILANGSVAVHPILGKRGYDVQDVLPLTEVEEIGGAGFGFMCIKSGVFETLSRPWFQSASLDVDIENAKYHMPIMGEDISLCKRAQDNGFKIWFDPTVRVIHQKTMKLTWEGVRPNV